MLCEVVNISGMWPYKMLETVFCCSGALARCIARAITEIQARNLYWESLASDVHHFLFPLFSVSVSVSVSFFLKDRGYVVQRTFKTTAIVPAKRETTLISSGSSSRSSLRFMVNLRSTRSGLGEMRTGCTEGGGGDHRQAPVHLFTPVCCTGELSSSPVDSSCTPWRLVTRFLPIPGNNGRMDVETIVVTLCSLEADPSAHIPAHTTTVTNL